MKRGKQTVVGLVKALLKKGKREPLRKAQYRSPLRPESVGAPLGHEVMRAPLGQQSTRVIIGQDSMGGPQVGRPLPPNGLRFRLTPMPVWIQEKPEVGMHSALCSFYCALYSV